jgi:hypothetical protein
MLGSFIDMPYSWDRKSKNGYEVSSAGDSRFSAFTAKIPNVDDKYPWTIEIYYQIIIKGYINEAINSKIPFNMWWKIGKGKPFNTNHNSQYAYPMYLDLWRKWSDQNPLLIEELAILAEGKVLTDKFASTAINQAHALSDILNEKFGSGIDHLKNKV